MTTGDVLARARAVATSWWALPALLVVVTLLLAWRLEAGRQAASTASRLAEEARLRAAGLLVVEQTRSRGLEAEARRLANANEDLAGELARARKAAPGAQVVGTASSSTGQLVAGGAPRPGPACPAAAPNAAAAPQPACLLAAGDEGEIRVDQVVLDGVDGAQLVVGAASAYRTSPEPRAKLFGGPFRAQLSTVKAEPPPAQPGWGAGVAAMAGRDGWSVGPAVAFPPARIFGLQLELVASATAGPSGTWQGGATGVARW